MEEEAYYLESVKAKFYINDIQTGLLWMVAAAVCSGLGNGLQTISPLAHLHIFTLLVGFEYLNIGFGSSLFGYFCTFSLTVLLQAIGTVLGFAGAVSRDGGVGLSLGYCLSASLIKWFLLTFLALFLHHAFMVKFPKSLLIPSVFPAAHTAVTMIIIGYSAGTLSALGGAVIDYAPLRYIGSFFGLGGVHFAVIGTGTYAALCFMRYRKIPIQQMAVMNLVMLVLALSCGAFIMQSSWLYQQSVSRMVTDTVPVSCVLGQDARLGSPAAASIINMTAVRAHAGDHVILMSESAFKVMSGVEEETILTDISTIARTSGDSSKPYIGVTYTKSSDDGDSFTNRFALFGPDGSQLWNYNKAYPSPVAETNTRPGNLDIPTAHGGNDLGKLGGAVGFDLDHPQYIVQAGWRQVDVLLQPAWTWQSMGPRHFDNNALRAIENGFTLFRCSSDGVSGVVSGSGPWGSVSNSQIITGHDTEKPALFQMPVRVRSNPKADGVMDKTFFAICGFAFDWIMLAFSVLVAIITIMPFRELDYKQVPVLSHILTAPNGKWSEFSFFPSIDSSYLGVRPESSEFSPVETSPQIELRTRMSSSSGDVRVRQPVRVGSPAESGSWQEGDERRRPVAASGGKPFKPKGPSFSSSMRNSSQNDA